MGITARAVVGIALLAGVVGLANGAIVLTNGSFETTGALYNGALGGLYESSGWTNLSGLNIQASSMPAGQEGTAASGATGSRILRLVSDAPDPTNTGLIVQNLGTMVAGENYTFRADAFGGPGAGLNWGATAAFVNQGVASPSVTYASQFFDGLRANNYQLNAYTFSYTALPADNGNPLYLWLRAKPSGGGQATRGGVDNARVTLGPPPPPAVIAFAGQDLSTHPNWRTTSVAKPMDSDGDNVYGTQGYYIRSSGLTMSSLPAYVSGVVNFAGSTFSNAAYSDFDDPRVAPGPSVVDLTDTGIFYSPFVAGTQGQEYDLLSFTLSQDAAFRLTVLTDNADPATVTPALLRLRGGGANSGLIPTTDWNRNVDYYFFDVVGHAGDQFILSGTKQTADSVGVAGIAFDATGDIPEPATMVLFVLGASAVAARLRRRRA